MLMVGLPSYYALLSATSWNAGCSLFKAEDALNSTSNGELENRGIKIFRLAGRNSTLLNLLKFLPWCWWFAQSAHKITWSLQHTDMALRCPALLWLLSVLVRLVHMVAFGWAVCFTQRCTDSVRKSTALSKPPAQHPAAKTSLFIL